MNQNSSCTKVIFRQKKSIEKRSAKDNIVSNMRNKGQKSHKVGPFILAYLLPVLLISNPSADGPGILTI